MKTLHLAAIAGTVSIGIMATILLISASNQVTVKTDWSSYAGSGTISVSGEVNPKLSNDHVLIQIFYPNGELYNSTKVPFIDNSNLYSYQFNIKPLGYGTADIFTVKATYGGKTASTSFEYRDNRYPGLALLPVT